MMSLLVQDFLKNHTFKELYDAHGVSVSLSKSGHKFSLNYDMIDSVESDKLSQQCRGLILSKADGSKITESRIKSDIENICVGETEILSYPMDRFFNDGQGFAATINWSEPVDVLEKLDGTCCIVYFDKFINSWCVSTRSSPDADIPLDNGIYTFRTLFEKALFDTNGESFDVFSSKLNEDYSYVFELTTPFNRIVVKYDEYKITLLAVRDKISLKELNLPKLDGIENVFNHNLKSISDIYKWLETTNPIEHEGVVLRTNNFDRVKVKSAAYVAAHRLRDTLCASPRNIMEFILHGKDDDVLSIVPQDIGDSIISIKEKFRTWLKQQESLYTSVLSSSNKELLGDRKTFALNVDKATNAFKPAFFAIYSNKADSIMNYIFGQRLNDSWSNRFIDNILESINRDLSRK